MIIIIAFFIFQAYSSKLPNCQIYPGEFWDTQQCYPCKNDRCKCVDFYECDQCIQGYYRDSITLDCELCPKGCSNCCERLILTKIVCTQCFNEYQLISGICIYQPQCEELFPNGKCKKCLEHFYLNTESYCIQCDDSCFKCVDESYCIQCRHNFHMSENFTSQQQNCIQCDDYHCNDCQLFNGTACSECFDDYFLDNGTCLPCIDHCDICNSTDDCSKCHEGFFFLKDKDGQIIEPITCKACSEIKPYCVKCGKDKYGKEYCEECMEGYYKDKEKLSCNKCADSSVKCLSHNINIECKEGYLLVELIQLQEMLCYENINLCRQIYSNDNSCLSCPPNHSLAYNNTCIKCNIEHCTVCKIKDPELDIENLSAINYVQQLICNTCAEGFFSIPEPFNQCVACIENCTSCLDGIRCEQCQNKSRVDDAQKCELCNIENCDVCKHGVDTCDTCSFGYGLIQTLIPPSCELCSLGCKICDNQRTCSVCEVGYFLENDVCTKYPQNCLKIDNIGKCSLCEIIDRTQYYIAYRGFCLLCSDYQTGYFFCPQGCIVDEIKSYNPNMDFIFLNFLGLYITSIFI